EADPAAGLQAPEADLQSLSSWRYQDGPQIRTLADEVLGSEVSRGQAGLAGQRWKEDRWSGRSGLTQSIATNQSGQRPANTRPSSTTGTSGLDSQAWKYRATAARHPDHARQSRTNRRTTRPGT